MHRAIAICSLVGAVYCSYQLTCPKLEPSVYEIEFSGKTGSKFTGYYQFTASTGDGRKRIEKVEATVPYSVSVSPPGGYYVSAGVLPSFEKDESVTTTISKDGKDCTEPLIQGSGSMNVMYCPL
jgi:hypothetical protein